MSMPENGLVVVAKRDCPTCQLAEPVYAQLAASGTSLTFYSQDDPDFPHGLSRVEDDTSLETSWRLKIDTVPTLLRLENGHEVARAIGWHPVNGKRSAASTILAAVCRQNDRDAAR